MFCSSQYFIHLVYYIGRVLLSKTIVEKYYNWWSPYYRSWTNVIRDISEVCQDVHGKWLWHKKQTNQIGISYKPIILIISTPSSNKIFMPKLMFGYEIYIYIYTFSLLFIKSNNGVNFTHITWDNILQCCHLVNKKTQKHRHFCSRWGYSSNSNGIIQLRGQLPYTWPRCIVMYHNVTMALVQQLTPYDW